jgi:hypothetical protein
VSDADPRSPMWTPTARTELARESRPYATCLTDAEWAVVGAMLPSPASDDGADQREDGREDPPKSRAER